MRRSLITSLLITLTLAACSGEPTVQPTPSELPVVGVTLVVPTASVNRPTTQPPNNPTTQPTPVPESVIGPESYPAGINPLTGLPVDPAALNRRPLAIKISNFPRYVRPQFGLSLADIVFEHYAEGGTTRFTAIFLGNDADKVGPIRSARLIDTVIPEMFGATLVASGSSAGVIHRLGFKDWFNTIIAEATGYQCPPLCRESEDTNSLYAGTAALHQALQAKGLDAPQPYRGVAYFNAPPAGGTPVNSLRAEFSGEAFAEWHYNSAIGRYERWEDSSPPPATDTAGTPIVQAAILAPHLDATTNQPITANNVVVLFVNHVVDFSIPEDFDTDGFTGHFSTEVQLWGSNPAWLLRDGQAYKLTWLRQDKGMVGLVNSSNNIVPLKPGNTWYEVVGLTSETLTDGGSWLVRHKSPKDKGEIPGVPTPTATLEGATVEAPTETPTP